MATNTLQAFKELLSSRRGGGLSFSSEGYYSLNSPLHTWASKVPQDHKPFVISIYKLSGKKEALGESLVTLGLFVNPSDIQIGNVFISSNQYTRRGWVSTLWGNQQSTISANGSTGGFYYGAEKGTGLTNFNRKDAITFINLLSLMSMFKNNGSNFTKESTEKDIYMSGFSRVINVMDAIKISYDGSEYLGEFISFTLEEDAAQPYRLNYTFEFVINGIDEDSPYVEGHIRTDEYDANGPIVLGKQGDLNNLDIIIDADKDELRNNPYLNLDGTLKKLDDLQKERSEEMATASSGGGSSKDRIVLPTAPKTNTTDDPVKNSSQLLELQYASGGSVARSKTTVKKQLANISRLNKNISPNTTGKNRNLTAAQAVDAINKMGAGKVNGRVNVADMNGILLMENSVSEAFEDNPSFAASSKSTARGLTQIIKGTYSDIVRANGGAFTDLMVSKYGYTKEEISGAHVSGTLDEDPFLGYMASAYYVANMIEPTVRKDKYDPNPQIIGLAYHNGEGGYKSTVRSAGADYAVTLDYYSEYLVNPNKELR
jgi:hypothetical protein